LNFKGEPTSEPDATMRDFKARGLRRGNSNGRAEG